MIRATRDIAPGEAVRLDPNLEDFHERFLRSGSISPFDPGRRANDQRFTRSR